MPERENSIASEGRWLASKSPENRKRPARILSKHTSPRNTAGAPPSFTERGPHDVPDARQHPQHRPAETAAVERLAATKGNGAHRRPQVPPWSMHPPHWNPSGHGSDIAMPPSGRAGMVHSEGSPRRELTTHGSV